MAIIFLYKIICLIVIMDTSMFFERFDNITYTIRYNFKNVFRRIQASVPSKIKQLYT
jgi:hypothetical protein